jgi:hypothetical protein
MTKETISSVIRDTEKRYTEDVTLGKFVKYNLYETTQQIQAYLNSKHLSGELDSQGYEKPWDDIVTEAVNTRTRATDLNVSNIRFIAPSIKYVTANDIFKVAMHEWFQEENFGIFLDKWGRELAEYNSVWVKIVEKKDKLYVNTVSWNNMIVDPVNVRYAPIIEKMYLTESELREKYSLEDGEVEELITTKRKLIEDGEIVGDDNQYYEIYEAHTEEWDKTLNKNINKMYVVSYLTRKSGDEDNFILYEGREEKCPYVLTHLSPTKDRTLGRGVVEQLIPKQWLVNHYTHITKKTLDFSTKIGFQTSDKSFTGLNALDGFDTGDILVTEENKSITQINNQAYDIVQIENVKAEQKASSRSISGVSEAMAGEVKSGSAWRQTEAMLQESRDLFNKMKEHKGLYLEIILSEYVVPFVLKRLNTKKEITAVLDSSSIEKIDKMYITSEATRRANKKALEEFLKNAEKGGIEEMQAMLEPDVQGEAQGIKTSLEQQGNQRFFKVSDIDDKSWGEYFKDFSTKVIIDITGESTNTVEAVTSLNTTLNTLLGAGLPISHPNVKIILGEILRQTNGISPLQLSDMEAPQPQLPTNAPAVMT